MTQFSAFTAGGLASLQAGRVDLNGVPWGLTGVAGTPGDSVPMGLLKFSKRFGGVIPNPARMTITGDNHRNIHEYLFNAAQIGELPMLFGALDMDFYQSVTGLKKVTDGNGNAVLVQANAPVSQYQLCVLAAADAKPADEALFGNARYINEIYPLVVAAPLMGNLQEVTGAEYSYFGLPTQCNKLPWGVAFSVSVHGALRGTSYWIGSDYPMVLESEVATVGQTDTTLQYTPASPASTYVKIWDTATGTPLSVTSAAGKVVTHAAMTLDHVYEIRYESIDLLVSI